MADGLLLWLATAKVDHSELEQAAITRTKCIRTDCMKSAVLKLDFKGSLPMSHVSIQNKGAGGGGGKRRGKKEKGRSADASFLLGFSVSSSERVNAGELDLPN